METNYNQLLSYVTPLETKSLNISTRSNNENTLLDYISQFSTDPQQQTKNGPGNLIQSEDNRIIKDVRTNPEDFLSEQAESIAQIEVAKTLKALKSTDIFTTKEYSLPSYSSPLANSSLYKGESDEVILTDRIKEKAEELNYSPVEIYYWVRNNIEFVPTWGAYQTAEHTMGSRQGNAFDTASLLIALLRASNIPARYVQGTIQVSPEKFQNWIGDFEDPESAITYAGKHGLPVTSLYNRNTEALVGVEIEHAWVEAAIDFHPSRGMKNKVADTWLAMDASFKQYEYLEGIDVEEVGEVDFEQVLSNFGDSGTINSDDGWLQGFDVSIIEDAQEKMNNNIKMHIKQMSDPTTEYVVGGGKIIIKEYPVLGANLENQLVTRGTDYIDVPTNYQAQIGIAIQPVLSSGLIEIEQPDITDSLVYYPLSQFNSEKVILRFTPSTESDENALGALIPNNAESYEDLPSVIGSGINVTPEIVLNNEVIITGSSLSIAKEVELGLKARLPNTTDYFSTLSYDVIAGSYLDIPIIGYSVNPYKLLETMDNADNTYSILASGDKEQIKALNRDEKFGDIVFTGGLSYFCQLHELNKYASHNSTGIGRVLVGYGTYGYEPRLRESGILATPTGIRPGTIATNVRVHQIAWMKSQEGNGGGILMSMGINSSILESAITEQIFCQDGTSSDCYAISTVSGLARAISQNQKIYQISSSNSEQLSNVAVSDSNMSSDISTAISSGGYVLLPESSVSGSGKNAVYVYMTYNGQTGAQSWKISGGLNGSSGIIPDIIPFVLSLVTLLGDLKELNEKLIDGNCSISNLLTTVDGEGNVIPTKLGKLFKRLGRVCAALGIAIDFIELLQKCNPTDAVIITGTLFGLGYAMTSFATFLLGGFATAWMAVAGMICVSMIIIPTILLYVKEIAEGLLCAKLWRKHRKIKLYV